MAMIDMESFDHYGVGDDAARLRMLEGPWAEVGGGFGIAGALPVAPAFLARTGLGCLKILPQSGGTFGGARKVLPATYTTLHVQQAVYIGALPSGDNTHAILDLRDSGNVRVGVLYLQSNGALRFLSEGAVQLSLTAANALTTGSWHQLEFKIVKHASAGVLNIKIDTVAVVTLAAQNTGATAIGQLRWGINGAAGDTEAQSLYIDDLAVNDASGARNNTLLGSVRVATLYPKADVQTGWTANRRAKFGAGICQINGDGDGLSCSDSAMLELSNDDYTLEAFVRFLSTPTGSHRASLFSKWRESTNERGFRFFLGGPSLNGGHLQLQTSSDGLNGTVASVLSAEFSPVPAHWYHVCLQRSAGNTVAFVDGVPMNAPAADATTYNDNTALFYVGAEQNGASTVGADTSLDGFLEEVRVTNGVARYNVTGFTPPVAAFARDVGGDPDFADVALLMGFDNSIMDDSSFGRAVTARGTAARFAVDDAAPGAFKTVDQSTPRDDTGVEAPFTAATNVLTFSGQPANNNTVTVDGVTYTFKTVFVNTAGNILIGATASDSIDNLVAAINGDAGAGTLYGTGTTASANASALNIDNDQMRVTADTPGTAGNAVGTTESGANTAWASGVTLAGGLNIPGPSSFSVTRLPAQTTGVKAVQLVARALKTDTGDGKIQMSFVTADASSANGAEHALTTDEAYYSDVIETDPSTSGGLTPASFIGASLRVDRTE